MEYRIFTYPVACDEAVAELNGFLSSLRMLRVHDEMGIECEPSPRFCG